MKQAILDGRLIKSRRQVHESVAFQLELPVWYGANLDALHDCLTSMRDEVRIVLAHTDLLEKTLGSWLNALRRMLREACAENPRLQVEERAEADAGFVMRVALVGNPAKPDVPFDIVALRRLKALGFNTVQLNIAWGGRPDDEPLNLEDILSPEDQPDERQRRWFDEIARRAALARAEGMRTIFHFGAPRLDKPLYEILGDDALVDAETEANSIQKEEIIRKYEYLITLLARRIPQVDDLLMYTFDQGAWLGNEFGEDALASGVPLHERIPLFLQRLSARWAAERPNGRLWWEPWEISAGSIYAVLPQLPRENFGLMLHSNIAEVQKANPVDRWLRNTALLAGDLGIPVCGEVFLTGANEETEPLQHIFTPALVWQQIHRLQEMELYGIKEYFGTRPDMPAELDLLMAGICFADPRLGEGEALAALAARWPRVSALPAAMAAAHRGYALYPWDLSWQLRVICKKHVGWHPYTRFWVAGEVAASPSWCSTRRSVYMLTENEETLHPWLIEDVGLRCRAAAEELRKAADGYTLAAEQCTMDMDAARSFAAAGQDFARFAAVAMDQALHAEQTLCAQNIRRFAEKGAVPVQLFERMTAALAADVENQKNICAVAPGTISYAAEALEAFRVDPVDWCRKNYL